MRATVAPPAPHGVRDVSLSLRASAVSYFIIDRDAQLVFQS